MIHVVLILVPERVLFTLFQVTAAAAAATSSFRGHHGLAAESRPQKREAGMALPQKEARRCRRRHRPNNTARKRRRRHC